MVTVEPPPARKRRSEGMAMIKQHFRWTWELKGRDFIPYIPRDEF